VLTAAGIKAALTGAPTSTEPSEGTVSQVRVTAVVDGDTLRVEDLTGHELVRVPLGIDAPEVAHPLAPAECYAEDATELLEQLAPVGSTVRLITDGAQPNRDRYDRLLRYVDHADVDVSLELLASGAVRRYDSAREPARGDAYAAAEDDAHDAGNAL
jgi:endonuclease YncB( thermonuclease family)